MNTTFDDTANCHDAPGTAADGEPPTEHLIPVMASRSSVIAAAAAMHQTDSNHQSDASDHSGFDDTSTASPSGGSRKRKRASDSARQRTKREADARLGIKQCPVRLPIGFHDLLRQRVDDVSAEHGSRALLALAAFLLRPELMEILSAIELREDCDQLLEGLRTLLLHDEWQQLLIRIARAATAPDETQASNLRVLLRALLSDQSFVDTCLAVHGNQTLRRLCSDNRSEVDLIGHFISAVAKPNFRELFERLSGLDPQSHVTIRSVLNLNDDHMRALTLAMRRPEAFKVLYYAAHNPAILSAMQIAIINVKAPALGQAIAEGRGVAGWIARTAARFL